MQKRRDVWQSTVLSPKGAVLALVLAAFTFGAMTTFAVQGMARAASDEELSVAEVYAKSAAGIVRVDVTPGPGRYAFSVGPGRDVLVPSGSGFVHSSGVVVTSRHVVVGASAIHVRLADGRVLRARYIAGDPDSDIALLDVDAPAAGLRPLTLADSSAVRVGDAVVAIGSPFGLASSVTAGIVSGVDRTIMAPDNSPVVGAIQTDAAINHGNSGGPLLDVHGDVIGVVAQFMSASGGNNGVALAVPSNTVRTVVTRLLSRRARTDV